jgi:hypothetical protein
VKKAKAKVLGKSESLVGESESRIGESESRISESGKIGEHQKECHNFQDYEVKYGTLLQV